MRAARIAHRAPEVPVQGPRVAKNDAGEEPGAAARQAPDKALLGRKPRALGPGRYAPEPRRGRARYGDGLGVKDPGRALRREDGLLVEAAGVARAQGRAQAPAHNGLATRLDRPWRRALRQPELGALGAGRGRKLQDGAPAGTREPRGSDQPPLHPRHASDLGPGGVAGRRQRPARGENRGDAEDHGPEKRSPPEHNEIRGAPLRSSPPFVVISHNLTMNIALAAISR
ncbi:MAG: hypothetical protein A2X37_03925 [Elusimicrobia bacterium GWA2_66_18]|nr:MAG: hypothetical protein A2X37_03925 [Elusimicrobia bacterium GWA2_66_18]